MANQSRTGARGERAPVFGIPSIPHVLLTCLGLLLASLASAQVVAVAVSLPPYGALLQELAGERATVTTVIPAGVSPHTFEPTPRLTAGLSGAELVIINGGLDEWVHDMLRSVGSEAPVIESLVELAEYLAEEPEHGADSEETTEETHDHSHLGVNPHVWLDPILMAELVPVWARALASVDPEGRDYYLERAQVLEQSLRALDSELQEMLTPVAGAPFIPFHDAWPYFAGRYGLDLIVEIEPFPGREPSPRYLAQVIDAIRESGARAIFNEAGLSDRPARVIAEEAGVGVVTIDPLGREGESYAELLRRNAEVILGALGAGEPGSPGR